MKATIGEEGLKVFARALRFLSGIGNDIYFEAKAQGLVLKAVSSSKTSYCAITLLEKFFNEYELVGTTYDESHCSVPARPLLHILKSIKNMRDFHIRIDAQKERLVIKTLMPKGFEFINTIKIFEHDNLEGPHQSKNLTNIIVCHPKVLAILLNSFPKNLKELSLDITSTRVEIINHINHLDKDVQTVRLSYKFETKEFISYNVSEDTKLIVLSKDFLSIIELADSSGDVLEIAFSRNGRPVTISIGKDAVIQVEMVLSSLREDTLKTLSRPPETSSYKELIGGYLDGRQDTDNNHQSVSEVVLTDTSMLRALSPSIVSYGSKRAGSEMFKRPVKRKSSEIAPNEASNSKDNALDESQKRQRTNETLTQAEAQEVSQIIASLSGLGGGDDDDDCIEHFTNSSHAYQKNESYVEPIQVGAGRNTTMFGTETDSDSVSIRFDISRAQMSGAAFQEIQESRKSSDFNNKNQPRKEKKNARVTSSQKARNAVSKKYVVEFLDLKLVREERLTTIKQSPVQAPWSDPESDDNGNDSQQQQ